VLDELKSRQANSVEGKMIGAARVTDGESVHAYVVERDHPSGKDRGDHFISLKIDAANFASAIVHIVISVELGVLGKSLDEFGGGIGGFAISEMLLDVGARAEQTLFFAGPQADADGAAHLEAGGLEDADGLEHHGGACAIVSGAGSGVPGIEVRAEHDDFVGFGFVGAGNFADDVEGVQIVVVELVLNIELKGDGNF